MKDMLVIVPSRGRPDSIYGLYGAFKDTKATCDLVIGLDDDDVKLHQYLSNIYHLEDGQIWPMQYRRERLCKTLNRIACRYCGEYKVIAFMGDDHRPRTRFWDRRFVECLSAGTGFVYGNDLLQGEKIPTAVAMTSDVVIKLGYMAPPMLTHLCLDLVWLDLGRAINRITYLGDVVIEHLHPANNKADNDTGYLECNSPDQIMADSNAYRRYKGEHFTRDVAILKESL